MIKLSMNLLKQAEDVIKVDAKRMRPSEIADASKDAFEDTTPESWKKEDADRIAKAQAKRKKPFTEDYFKDRHDKIRHKARRTGARIGGAALGAIGAAPAAAIGSGLAGGKPGDEAVLGATGAGIAAALFATMKKYKTNTMSAAVPAAVGMGTAGIAGYLFEKMKSKNKAD